MYNMLREENIVLFTALVLFYSFTYLFPTGLLKTYDDLITHTDQNAQQSKVV